jgi:hypothetical protein
MVPPAGMIKPQAGDSRLAHARSARPTLLGLPAVLLFVAASLIIGAIVFLMWT